MRIELGYPGREAEKELLKQGEIKRVLSGTESCLKSGDVLTIQEQINEVHLADAILEYVQDILDFTRTSPHFYVGLSPRAGLALLRATQSWAFLHGRDHALPEDLQKVMPWVVGHRLRSKDDLSEIPRDKLTTLLMEVPIP
jgi:MoxR-like ATPase